MMDKRHRLAVAGLFAVLTIMQPALPGNDFAVGKMYDGQDTSSNPKMVSLPPSQSQGIYAPDLNHIWNRLYRHLYARTAQNGQEYGYDGLDPLLWYQTKYLLDGKSYHQAVDLLDEFLSTHAEKLIADSLKRAMLQRDLWSVFDWLSTRSDDHQTQRRELQVRLAQIIKRLTLTSDQIEALPDNYTLAVAARVFPTQYQPDRGKAPFLPPDIFEPDGPWVCISNNRGGPVAPSHAQFFNGRSTFLVFVRLPGGREATLAYLKVLRDFSQPWIVSTNRSLEPDPILPNPDLPQFPIGTQLALIRQLALIDAQGNLTPTHLTESIQIRVYRAAVYLRKIYSHRS